MRFSTATVFMLSAVASAATIPQKARAVPDSVEVHFSGTKSAADGTLVAATEKRGEIEKREIILAILTTAGTAALTKATTLAVDYAADQIKNLANWTNAREAFTQATTLDMWNNNPDPSKYFAAICYNKGYRVKDSTGIDGKVSAKLTSGILNTDYDCMYMAGNNQFYTDSDGGYINLSYRYRSDKCSFDQATGDLTCQA